MSERAADDLEPKLTIRLQTSPYIQRGQVVVMADHSHPETPVWEFGLDAAGGPTSKPAEDPDGRVVICHPDDERALRAAGIDEFTLRRARP